MLLKDKMTIITGAGRGIGKAAALKFGAEGASVAVISRTPAQLEATADEIRRQGGTALPISCDISVQEDVEKMTRQVIETFGRIDILVNNAARSSLPVAELVNQDVAQWDETFAINARGTMLCSKYALKDMIPRRSGNIITVSSSAGQRGITEMVAYCASKAAIIGFTQALAAEVGKYNIRVNCCVPAAYTELMVTYYESVAQRYGKTYDEVVQEAADHNPIRRLIKPEECADAMLYLASDLSSAVHGQSLNVDGGSITAMMS